MRMRSLRLKLQVNNTTGMMGWYPHVTFNPPTTSKPTLIAMYQLSTAVTRILDVASTNAELIGLNCCRTCTRANASETAP